MANFEAILMALTALAVGVTGLGRGPDTVRRAPHELESKLVVAHVEHNRDAATGRVVRSLTLGFDLRESRGTNGAPIMIQEDLFNHDGELSERLSYRGRTWTWDAARQAKVERRLYEVIALADTQTPERFREVYLFNARGEHFATEREVH